MLRVVVHLIVEEDHQGRDLELPAEVPVQELVGLIRRALVLTSSDPDGEQLTRWSLRLASGELLDGSQSLAGQGVFDGTHLVLVGEVQPSALAHNMVWCLESASGRRYPVPTDRVILGRAGSAHPAGEGSLIDLGDEPNGQMVSRTHAWLERVNGRWQLIPSQAATNRTLVNGNLVAGGMTVQLSEGDRIQLARVGLVLRRLQSMPEASSTPEPTHGEALSGYRSAAPGREPADPEVPDDHTGNWLRDMVLSAAIVTSLFTAGWAVHAQGLAQPSVDGLDLPPPSEMHWHPATPAPEVMPPTASLEGGGVVIEATFSSVAEAVSTDISQHPTTTAIPSQVRLEGIPIGKQARKLSCELQTASDLAWFYGVPYSWEELFLHVGHDPGGNPHVGFAGRSLNDSPGQLYPYGYGVYAEPIAAALRELGLDARVHYNESRGWLQERIAAGHPVMIWAVGGMRVAPIEEWIAADGTVVRAVRLEHTFLVVGYDPGGVWVHDPWDAKERFYSWEQFEASWDLLERMSVTLQGRLREIPEWQNDRLTDAS